MFKNVTSQGWLARAYTDVFTACLEHAIPTCVMTLAGKLYNSICMPS